MSRPSDVLDNWQTGRAFGADGAMQCGRLRGHLYSDLGDQQNTGRCTVALAVNQGSSTGPVGAVSADHCGTNQDWVGPIDNQPMGRSNAGRPDLDAVVLQGRTYVGRTWYRAHNENPGRNAPVIGTTTPVVGNAACPNGGYSGMDCRTRIISVNQDFRFEPTGR